MTFHPDSLPDLTGRVYVVTGATSGVGYHTAARLAEHNAHVFICARTAEKGSATLSRIRSTSPAATLSVLTMDHERLSSVVEAAKQFVSSQNRLDGLINNAGIMATPFALTADGYEAQWQTNYLAHYVFTFHLLPVMLRTVQRAAHAGASPGSVRIVNLSSSGHYLSAPKEGIVFADTNLEHASGMTRYGQSKLANVLHTKTLNKLYGPDSPSARAGEGEVWVTAVNPGFVKSELGVKADLPLYMSMAAMASRWLGAEFDTDRGSWTSLYCAASADMRKEESGKYFQRIADPNGKLSSSAKDEQLAADLEKWTKDVLRQGGWLE
ncbi:putative carbonyl reductase [Boeremia exigua]|uniref:putative carbonyl reductase n=1 Tax=Boeremia exigua TaxID=749465 RepID=UPI001E8ED82C|nr:putative carbonyl reductase [Boeremia exigua]KAH6616848.1 putative carbonyl reductase [Boeremia exigua]